MVSCACHLSTQELEAGGCGIQGSLSYIVRSRLGLYGMMSKHDKQEV